MQASIRESAYDTLVEHYHEELMRSLKVLNYSKTVPSLNQLHLELKQKGIINLAAFVESYAASELTEEDALQFDTALKNDAEGEEYREKFLSNPKVIETARQYLPFLRRKGMLDLYY